MKIRLGSKGITRDGSRVAITRELTPDDPGYSDNYRFEGTTEPQGDAFSRTVRYILYTEDGLHASSGYSSTPSDIIRFIYNPRSPVLVINVKEGDIAGVFVDDKIVDGMFTGWVPSDVYRIRHNDFTSFRGNRSSSSIKYYEIVVISICSEEINHDNPTSTTVRSVLVAWADDKGYWATVLTLPSAASLTNQEG